MMQLDTQDGSAVLPEMRISDSSEALLGGKQPSFYLYAVALMPNGQPAAIEPAVSEAFVVRTTSTTRKHTSDQLCIR